MPGEVITFQVGQCGNQIGRVYWDKTLREHAAHTAEGEFTTAMGCLFQNLDVQRPHRRRALRGAEVEPVKSLKARAVLVDMEEGVVTETMKGYLGGLFDTCQLITGVSGSGNNWAQGHHGYGSQYHDELLECARIAAERCDSLQGFLMMHSLCGGTGSGLGCYILEMLQEEFPLVPRMSAALFPSDADDVVTSPLNSLLSLASLAQHASCVLALDNQALADVADCNMPCHAAWPATSGRKKTFDVRNSLVADVLLGMMAPFKYGSSLYNQMGKMCSSLAPFPSVHFLLPSLAPMAMFHSMPSQAFSDLFSPRQQLLQANPCGNCYLSSAILMRGKLPLHDGVAALGRIKPKLKVTSWDPEPFKLDLCPVAPAGLPYSLLSLANNCCIKDKFTSMHDSFSSLFRRRCYLHHYATCMELEEMMSALEVVSCLIDDYTALQGR